MGRFLPLLVAAEVLGADGSEAADLIKQNRKLIQAAIKSLYGYQKSTGGWGWWSDDKEDPYMTAYVFWGLSRAARAGIEVDRRVLDDALGALTKHIRDEEDPNRLAFQMFAYTYATGKLHERIRELKVARGLNAYGRALVVLALSFGGKADVARVEAGRLAESAVRSGPLAHWPIKRWFYKWEGVEVEATAFCVWALLETGVARETAEAAIRWLLNKCSNGYWANTKNTSAVVFALSKYISCYGDTLPLRVELTHSNHGEQGKKAADLTLLVDGRKVDQKSLDPQDPFTCIAEFLLTEKDLGLGKRRLEVSTGSEALRRGSRLEWRVEWTEKGPAVAEGGMLRIRWMRGYEGMRVGQERVVSVEVFAQEEASFAVVSIPVPAGCRIVGPVRGSGCAEVAGFESRYREALLFVRSLRRGRQALSVRVRAVFAGLFWMQPARVFCMYAPEKQAHTATTQAEILP